MPELPEVETMVRGIRPHVEGRRIAAFRACACRCRPITLAPSAAAIARKCVGRTVTAVRRRAKRVILDLAGDLAFVIEPRMTGLMLIADPPDVEHLRLEWRFAGRQKPDALWFWDQRGLGTVRLLAARELETVLAPERLGPDALEISTEDWRTRLRATRRPVKVALLDQRVAAGIGNLYASEILHVAQINPRRRASTLGHAQIGRLAEATRAVLEDAIRHEGSTLSDGTYRNALAQSGAYQNAHRVYDREGELCPTCGAGSIRRIVQAQRSTFFCPACQR